MNKKHTILYFGVCYTSVSMNEKVLMEVVNNNSSKFKGYQAHIINVFIKCGLLETIDFWFSYNLDVEYEGIK